MPDISAYLPSNHNNRQRLTDWPIVVFFPFLPNLTFHLKFRQWLWPPWPEPWQMYQLACETKTWFNPESQKKEWRRWRQELQHRGRRKNENARGVWPSKGLSPRIWIGFTWSWLSSGTVLKSAERASNCQRCFPDLYKCWHSVILLVTLMSFEHWHPQPYLLLFLLQKSVSIVLSVSIV